MNSQLSHRSSPSQHSRDITLSTEPPASPQSTLTPNHHGNYYNQEAHSTPIRANLVHKEERQVQSPLAKGYDLSHSLGPRSTLQGQDTRHREAPYGNGYRTPQRSQEDHWPSDDLESSLHGRGEGWKETKHIPEFIPEEEGVSLLYPSHRRHNTRTTPPRLCLTQYVQSFPCISDHKCCWQA